jgi:hypothetical protein
MTAGRLFKVRSAFMSAATRLLIGPVIERTQQLASRVRTELPDHDGLAQATQSLIAAAQKAERVARSMKRPWSPHRLPVVFLGVALVALGAVLYWQFFHVARLRLALPDRDASALRERVATDARVDVTIVEVPGSREAVALLAQGQVDVGFVQGGVPIPRELARLETPSRELVLYFVRAPITRPSEVRKVLTSLEAEGSHSVARAFFEAWGVQVEFVHGWKEVVSDAAYQVPADVDAVLVVKDPGDENALRGAAHLTQQGFHLASPWLGARVGRFDWLQPTTLEPGYLQVDPAVPPTGVDTYSVSTFLVARQGLTPRLLAEAAEVVAARPRGIEAHRFNLGSAEASELFQGVDASLSILVNLGLAFLALLGLDVVAYRKQFHELNSLVSLIAMLQSNKDVLGVTGARQREHVLYLSLCSDMLSLISAVSGYYTQENSALLFNNLSELIHQRCDGLKLNIQLKLLHAMVRLEG